MEWVELLFDAPDHDSVDALAERLRSGLGDGAQLLVGAGPQVSADSPRPPRYIATALLGAPDVDREVMRNRLEDALSREGIRFDQSAIAETLELTVVFI